jgi:hypothetical protein
LFLFRIAERVEELRREIVGCQGRIRERVEGECGMGMELFKELVKIFVRNE